MAYSKLSQAEMRRSELLGRGLGPVIVDMIINDQRGVLPRAKARKHGPSHSYTGPSTKTLAKRQAKRLRKS